MVASIVGVNDGDDDDISFFNTIFKLPLSSSGKFVTSVSITCVVTIGTGVFWFSVKKISYGGCGIVFAIKPFDAIFNKLKSLYLLVFGIARDT